MEEGYIKYQCHWKETALPDELAIENLIAYRNVLFEKGWIGVYADGIGFGNISERYKNRQFIISGTQTGHFPVCDASHFALVTHYHVLNNEVYCKGKVKASSESLTHAILYELYPDVNAVLHIHDLNLWRRLLQKVPTTRANVTYGTVEMAFEVARLSEFEGLREKGIFVMAGHEEGIVTFGNDMATALDILLDFEKDR